MQKKKKKKKERKEKETKKILELGIKNARFWVFLGWNLKKLLSLKHFCPKIKILRFGIKNWLTVFNNCSKQLLRTLLSTASTWYKGVEFVNIKGLFYKVMKLIEMYLLFLQLIKVNQKEILKLKRCIYDLCNTPRIWCKESSMSYWTIFILSMTSKWCNQKNYVDVFVYCSISEWL